MKQKFLLKTMLLLCALVVGSSNMWADTVSFIFTGDDANCKAVSGSVSGITYATGKTGSATATAYNTTNGLVLYGVTSGGGYFNTTKAISGDITNIAVTTNNKKNSPKYTVYGSTDGEDWTQIGSQTDGGSTANFPTTAGYTYVKIANTTAATAQLGVNSIVITYTADEKTDPTITFNNGSLRVGKTLDLSTLFTSNSEGAVTYSITAGDSYASLSGSVLTGEAVGSVTVQASQAAAGSFNAKAVTATITVNAALTLSSIAITTAPTTLIYTEGETFDATDMVVTATYSDASTDDVTALCTWTPSGALTTADVEITVSYTENGTTKTATQAITVNPYVQPTSVTIDMNYTWLGSSNGANLAPGDLPVMKNDDNVITTITEGASNQPRGDEDYIRVYKGSTITFAAPAGYCITSLVFTTGGSNTWNAPTVNTGTLSDKTWTGYAGSVEFTLSGSCFIASVEVTLSTNVPVTITDAEYATFCNATTALDFSTTGITVYTAEDKETSVALNEVTSGQVPANTPVVLYKAGADGSAINVPVVASADAPAGTNDLRVSDGTTAMSNAYVLAKKTAGVGFYPWGGATLSAGKIYLQAQASYGAREFIGFGDATGIDSVTRDALKNGKIYNLQGQEVKNATKGIFVVNGKKVFLK